MLMSFTDDAKVLLQIVNYAGDKREKKFEIHIDNFIEHRTTCEHKTVELNLEWS